MRTTIWILLCAVGAVALAAEAQAAARGDAAAASSDVGRTSASSPATLPAGGWRVMPIRTEEEARLGLPGGESEQHPHSIARSPRDPNILYLSHDVGQAWKSLDGGRSWRKTLGVGLSVVAGQSIEVDPVDCGRVLFIVDNAWNYLARKFTGVYLSTDGGESWRMVLASPGRPQRAYQHCLAYDPASVAKDKALRWYAAFPSGGLYRSEDGGEAWKQVADLSDANDVLAVAAHPTDGKTVYVACGKGLLASDNRGEGLAPIGNLPPGGVSCVWVNPRQPAEVLAVLAGQGLYRSADAGKTFSLLKAHEALHVFVSLADPRRMCLSPGKRASGDGPSGAGEYAARGLASQDGGKTWAAISSTPGPGPGAGSKTTFRGPQTAVSFHPTDANEAVAFSVATLWRSTDGGRTFAESAAGFTGFAAVGMAFDAADPNRFALFCCDISTVTTDNGGRWFRRNADNFWDWKQRGLISWMGMYAGEFKPVAGSQELVASVGYYFDCKLVRSINGGRNWSIVNSDVENYLFVGYHRRDPNFVFGGRSRSTDGGATWKVLDALKPYRASILGLCRDHPDTVYAVASPRNQILRSDDRGDTWRVYAQTTWLLNRMDSHPTFAVDPRDADKVYTVDAAGDLATFDGKAWRSLGVLRLAGGEEQKNFIRKVAIDPRRPEVLYAGAHAAGLPCVFRSTDAGATWTDITENLPRLGCAALAVHPLTGDLLHGSMYGTWLRAPPYDSPGAIRPRLKGPPD
jgi:photosystem II stability/assembly factor-like uncharacterized protein